MQARSYKQDHGWVRSLAAATLIWTCGCHAHARLSAPEPSAAAAERIAAFERLHSQGRMDSVVVQGDREVARNARFLVLANGQRVYYAQDLIGAVGEHSPSGRAAAASGRSRKKKFGWYAAGVIGMTVGTAVALAGLNDMDVSSDDPGTGLPTTFYVGLGAVAVSAGALFVGDYYGREESDERATAFMTYDESLRKRLRLCVKGQQIVDCDTLSTSNEPTTSSVRPY